MAISPRRSSATPGPSPARRAVSRAPHPLTPHDLQHPEPTGMSRKQLSELTHILIPALESAAS
ncbi:hypothetical protein [Streptomyces sp. T028]|uniref:hypothetical protein n=1 Tax=Streptomyces sp. T028 TaxID=3394379 RepID=UPI003A8766F9